MSVVQFVSESYNGQNTVRANVGDWVDGIVTFQTRFQVGSGTADSLTYISNATTASLVFQQTDFDESGFMVGDSIDITYTDITSGTGVITTVTRTINYVSGTQIQLNSGLPGIANGTVFPTDGNYSGISIVADKKPDAIEYFFNLAPNGSNSLGSVVDASLTRLQLENTDILAAGVPTAMSQLGDGSGSYIKDVLLEYVGSAGSGWNDWKLTFTFIQWGFIKDGYTTDNPPYYAGIDHIAPLNRVKAFAELGNPNGIIIGNTQNTQANTGGFDENYNGGNSLYVVQSTSWVDSLGDPIDSLDYSGTCTFTSVISAPGQANPQSNYLLGLIWRPTDGTYYQQRIPSIANNLLLLAPDYTYQADGVTDATVHSGFPFIGDIGSLNTDGAQWDLKDVNISISGVDEITIVGTIVPNAAASSLFVDVPNGGRKSTVWVSIGDYLTDGATNSKRVSLKLWDEDNYDAPTLGVQIPDVVDENLYDHDLNDIDTPLPQTTTEDDVLYISNFKLLDGLAYEGIRTRIFAYNTVTEEEFTLEDNFFSFTNVPFISGIFEVNETQARNFNLPPTTDRNEITLVRNGALDGGGKYGVTLEYGFLNDWRYWLEESDANDDFFDYTIPDEHYGKNKDWQHYSNSGNWIIRVAYYTRLAGVDDFNYYEMGVRPYEDDVNVTAVTNFTVLSNGQTPNALVADELIEIETVFTWAGFVFTNEWVEYTVENFENGNRWVMSSVLAQGNIAQNPLKPISGQTLIDVAGTGTNTLTCKANIDTTLIDVNKVSLSFRVYSEDTLAYVFLLTYTKEADIAYSLRKLSDNTIWSGDCIKVRRDTDNAELDIPFLDNVLDEVTLLDHVTDSGNDPAANGYVVTWYDQSGGNRHATNATASEQPQIVGSGVVLTSPNGKPAVDFDGIADNLSLVSVVGTTQLFYQSFVFDRSIAGINSIGLGDTAVTPTPFAWLTDNSIYSEMTGTVIHDTAQTGTGDYIQTTLRDGSDDIKMWRNNVADTAQNEPNTVDTMGSLGVNFTNFHNGRMQELVYYKRDKEASRTSIESNTNNFYSIF